MSRQGWLSRANGRFRMLLVELWMFGVCRQGAREQRGPDLAGPLARTPQMGTWLGWTWGRGHAAKPRF